MRRVLLLLTLFAMTGLATGCGGSSSSSSDSSEGSSSSSSGATTSAAASDSEGPIVLGAAVAETGFLSAYDLAPTQELKLAIKKRNEEGGVDGRELQLHVKDTAGELTKAKTVATELVEEGISLLVVSCDYDYGAPAAQVAQQAGVLTMSICAGSLKFGAQGIGSLAYTPATSAKNEGGTAADWALQKKHWTKAFVIEDPTNSYDEEACSGFKERFEPEGGEIVGEATFKNSDPSIATQVAELSRANPKPEFIRLCSYPPGAGTAIKQIRSAGIDLPILGLGAMDGTYWLNAIPNVSDLYWPAAASIYGDDPNPEVNAAVKEYNATYKTKAANYYMLYGGVLLTIYATAVERAGSAEPAAVSSALNEFSDVETAVGPTSYTEEIHIPLIRPWRMIEVKNAKPAYIEMFEAAAPPAFKVE